MLCLSEDDLKGFIANVIRKVAKELGIDQWERQKYYQLVLQIKTRDQQIFDRLDQFFVAYKKWHDFQVKLSQEHSTSVPPKKKERLRKRIEARDTARELLLQALRKNAVTGPDMIKTSKLS